VLHDGIRALDVVTMHNIDLCKHPLLSITLWTSLLILALPACSIFPRERVLPRSVEAIPDSDKYKLPGHDFAGYLVAIDDSDKLVISYHDTKESFSLRLYGIGAPEKGQPYWQEAKDFLHNFSVGKWVKVLHAPSSDKDSKGRLIAIVDLPNGTLVNEELVKAGRAWVHDEVDVDSDWEKNLKTLEQEARESKRGLWADAHPVPPWVYRKARGE
jgi:endonuclease YncB( thermonuclease family)